MYVSFIPYSRALQVEGLMAGLVAAVVAPVGAVVAQLIAALSIETSTEESPAVRVRCAPFGLCINWADFFEEPKPPTILGAVFRAQFFIVIIWGTSCCKALRAASDCPTLNYAHTGTIDA